MATVSVPGAATCCPSASAREHREVPTGGSQRKASVSLTLAMLALATQGLAQLSLLVPGSREAQPDLCAVLRITSS